MNYCQKCGKQLNEGELFCSNCGTKVDFKSDESVYSNNYRNSNVVYTTHPLSKAGLIMSIIGLVLFIIESLMIGFADYKFAYGLFVLLYLLLITISGAALGTSIPGFVITKKRNMKNGIATAALVLSIILDVAMLFIFVILPSSD